jgi:transposase
MSRPRSPMRKIREVLRLVLENGMSRREVSEALRVPLTTVNDYMKRASAAAIGWPLPDGIDDATLEHLLFPPRAKEEDGRLLPNWEYVRRELAKKGVTKWLLWEEYKQECPEGYGYTQFTRLYKKWSKSLDLVMRQKHKAGEKMFVDYAGATIPIYDPKTWEVSFKAQLFVSALGASGHAGSSPSSERCALCHSVS